MLPGAYDLEVYRGDTARWRFQLWQDQARTVPVDLTGTTASAQIRATADSAAVLVQLACNVASPNIVDVVLPAGSAATLPAQGAWDLQLIWPGGDVQTVLAGLVSVVADVTRAG